MRQLNREHDDIKIIPGRSSDLEQTYVAFPDYNLF